MPSLFNIAVSKNSLFFHQKPKTKMTSFTTKNNNVNNLQKHILRKTEPQKEPVLTIFTAFKPF